MPTDPVVLLKTGLKKTRFHNPEEIQTVLVNVNRFAIQIISQKEILQKEVLQEMKMQNQNAASTIQSTENRLKK